MQLPESRAFGSVQFYPSPARADRTKNRRRALVSLMAAIAVVDCTSRLHATTQTSTWVGSTSNSWSAAANWNPSNTDPNNGNATITDFDVVINSVTSPDVAPTLNTSVTIDGLNLSSGATLAILGSDDLTLNGLAIINDGVITLNSNNNNNSTMTFAGGNLSGTGTITLNSTGASANLAGTLTQLNGHTINGFGEITAALQNDSTVDASVSGQTLTLATSAMTNDNLMEATGAAVLSISGITLTQVSPGQVSASGSGSLVTLVGGATISGGALNTSSGGIIQVTSSSTDTLANVTNNGTLDIIGASDLNITGNLVDNGTITVNSNANNNSTMTFSGGILSGTGAVVLNSTGTTAVLAGPFAQSSGHTIKGYGDITAGLTNNGTIDASVSGQTLSLTTSAMTNNNLMEATGAAILSISGITLTQVSPGQVSASGTGSLVTLVSGATISGGTLNSSSGGIIQVTNSSTDTLAGVTNNATVNIIGASDLNITGNLVDNGAITVNSNNSNNSTMSFSGGTLSGTGTITLGSTGTAANLAGTLTQSSGHTINGFGDITAVLTNHSLVNATDSGQTLFVNGATVTNTATMEATTGPLTFNNSVAVNNAGGIIDAVGSNVTLANASITGGTLKATSPNVILTETATLSGLTVAPNTTVDVLGGTNLTLTGSTLTNNGNIELNYANNNVSTLQVNSVELLTGSGSLTLNSAGIGAVIATGTGDTLTQDVNHTMNGFGEITGSLINNGTVDASVSGQTLLLTTTAMTNNSLMEATGAAILSISGITLTQVSPGQVSASGTGSLVTLVSGATISGGTLNSSSGGIIQVTNSSTDTLAGVTNNATVNIIGASDLNITGNLVDNGAITVNSNNNNNSTMSFSGGTLSGTGTITLGSTGASANLAGTLIQSSGHTINGFGEITAAVTNNGTVDASVSGQTMILTTGPMTNNSVMEATSSGILAIGNVTITQNSTGEINPSGGIVQFSGGATITGGTLGAGTINNTSGTNTIGGLTSSATLNVLGGTNLNISSPVVNNGVLAVDSNSSNSSTVSASGAITGTGTINILPGGKLVFAAGVGGSSQNSLSISGSGTLDLNNNHLFINYGAGPDPIASIAAWIADGAYAGGTIVTWTGTGITSSAAHGNPSYGIGYADYADPGNPAGLASGQIEIAYTLLGDANLDDKVNGTDFNLMATNFNQAVTAGWDKGDFNYDGKVNGNDFVLLAANFNQFASQSDVSAADLAALDSFAAANGINLTSVPEPASAVILSAAGLGILRRRRRFGGLAASTNDNRRFAL